MPDVRTWFRGLIGGKEEADAGADDDTRLVPGPMGRLEMGSFTEGSNEFAVALYGHLRQLPGNVFLSPFSVRAALGMAHAGAKGDTAAQMSEALRLSLPDDVRHAALAEITLRLNAAGGGAYEMEVANSLWGQDGAPLEPRFLDLVARHYGGGMNLVDFRRGAEGARVAINNWVVEKTKRKIRDLIPSGGVDAETRLVLVNAVYFKGMWVVQFRKEATRDESFFLEGGGTVRAPLMHQETDVRYLRAEGFQVVDLNYRGRDLSMLVLLPDRRDGLPDLERKLSARVLHDCVARMDVREVEIYLPRFKITWGSVDLSIALAALGMSLAFARFQADFSGINGHAPPHEDSLFISAVYHKAFVDVNEEGTEAAAATAVVMRETMALRPSRPPPVPIFRADHPFLFAIRDRKSGTILFLGRMIDPTRES